MTLGREKMIRGRENCKNGREKKKYNGPERALAPRLRSPWKLPLRGGVAEFRSEQVVARRGGSAHEPRRDDRQSGGLPKGMSRLPVQR